MMEELPRSGSPVPDQDHILRYIAPRHVENGIVNGAGFLRKPSENAPSVSWLEFFEPPTEDQVQAVRAATRLTYAKTGHLVRLNVGQTRKYVRENTPEGLALYFVHDPLDAEGEFQRDPSHALIVGVPTADSAEADLIKDLIADCILQPLYAAVPK